MSSSGRLKAEEDEDRVSEVPMCYIEINQNGQFQAIHSSSRISLTSMLESLTTYRSQVYAIFFTTNTYANTIEINKINTLGMCLSKQCSIDILPKSLGF